LTNADKAITHAHWCSEECPRRSPPQEFAEQHLTRWGRLREVPARAWTTEPGRLPRRAAQSMPAARPRLLGCGPAGRLYGGQQPRIKSTSDRQRPPMSPSPA